MKLDLARIASPARALLLGVMVVFFTGLSSQSSAAIYRWVDSAGREHFTMELEQVPPEYRSAAAAAEQRSRKRMNVVGDGASSSDREANSSGGPTPHKLDPKKPAGHDEAWWRAEHRRHVSELAQARKAVESAKTMNLSPAYYGNTRYERGKARNAAKRQRGAAVAQAQERVRIAEQKLADFVERARRAGVPPGWLR